MLPRLFENKKEKKQSAGRSPSLLEKAPATVPYLKRDDFPKAPMNKERLLFPQGKRSQTTQKAKEPQGDLVAFVLQSARTSQKEKTPPSVFPLGEEESGEKFNLRV